MTEEERKNSMARETFQIMKETLDENNWAYEEYAEKMIIACGVKGDDLPMNFNMYVNPEHMRIIVRSLLPFDVSENKRVEMAVAVSFVNNMLVAGCFEFDMTDGCLSFRMSNSYDESPVSKKLVFHMLATSSMMVDEFNDKFFMLSKGMISLEQFINNQKGVN